jgi:hypothetical protein
MGSQIVALCGLRVPQNVCNTDNTADNQVVSNNRRTKGTQEMTTSFTTATPAEITKAAIRDYLADADYHCKGRHYRTMVRSLCTHAYVEASRRNGFSAEQARELDRRIEVFMHSDERVWRGGTNVSKLERALDILIAEGLPA